MSDQKDITTIPYFAHEGEMNRLERVNRRQFVLILILIIALVGTNLAWIVYENSFTDVETTIEAEQDGSGVNIVGGGDISYGTESESDD